MKDDTNEVTEEMIDDCCNDILMECKHKTLILTTRPYQWKSPKFKIRHLREILGEARAYNEFCPASYKPKVKRAIKAIASVIDEHNRCVKEMCE